MARDRRRHTLVYISTYTAKFPAKGEDVKFVQYVDERRHLAAATAELRVSPGPL